MVGTVRIHHPYISVPARIGQINDFTVRGPYQARVLARSRRDLCRPRRVSVRSDPCIGQDSALYGDQGVGIGGQAYIVIIIEVACYPADVTLRIRHLPYLQLGLPERPFHRAHHKAAAVRQPGYPFDQEPALTRELFFGARVHPYFAQSDSNPSAQALCRTDYDFTGGRPRRLHEGLATSARGQLSFIPSVRVCDYKLAFGCRARIADENKLLLIRRKTDGTIDILNQTPGGAPEHGQLIQDANRAFLIPYDVVDVVSVARKRQAEV